MHVCARVIRITHLELQGEELAVMTRLVQVPAVHPEVGLGCRLPHVPQLALPGAQ